MDLSQICDRLDSEIERVFVVDGSYQEVSRQEFPSSKICFYIIGIQTFLLTDLKALDHQQTIGYGDMRKLRAGYERFEFVMPIQNICFQKKDLKTSFRETLYKNFKDEIRLSRKYSLLDTLKWLVFQEYANKQGSISIPCWCCGRGNDFSKQKEPYQDERNNFLCCPQCGEVTYITDCLQLHTLIDEAKGATGAESFIMSACEVVLTLSMFRFLWETKNTQWLPKILFIKDGPLALFSRLDDFAFKVVRVFLQFLYDKSLRDGVSYANWIGLEKNGEFVDHLKTIETRIPAKNLVLLNADYIKRYIRGDGRTVFGENTYFGIKMFVKSNFPFVLNVAIPFGHQTRYQDYIQQPKIENFLNLKHILEVLDSLKCPMYGGSFTPIVMANDMVSLSNIPSQRILEIFSRDVLEKQV